MIKKQIPSYLSVVWLTGLICVAIVFQSCQGDPNSPGVEFMPDMYRSPSLETYQEAEMLEDDMEARLPAEGSVPRGFMPYPYPNTNEGYEKAGAELTNPIPYSEDILKQGEALYSKFCVHCHGAQGMGDGAVVTNGGFPPPPPYSGPQLKYLPEGKIFHSMTYGKNLMPPHASQLTKKERWKLVHFVQHLQDPEKAEKQEDVVLPETKDVEVEATEEETPQADPTLKEGEEKESAESENNDN